MPREKLAQAWWYMPFIPILRSREYQVDTCEFKTKLVYIVSSRAARLPVTPCLKTGNVVQLVEHYLERMKPWVP